ncbi:2-keto-4-pentenoate hydratase [Bradyrhizobium sp. USDA 4011]
MSPEHHATQDFWNSARAGEAFPTQWARRLSVPEGYRIQFEIADRLAQAGNPRAGWKVATVNKILQEQLGVTEPFFGSVRGKSVFEAGYRLPASSYCKPHVETEICFRVTKGIEIATTAEAVRQCLDACYPAFELVEKRCPVPDLGVALADNAEHAAIVLGAPVEVTDDIAFGDEGVSLYFNGKEVGTGQGSAILGDPVRSVLWLNDKLREFGRTLLPGQLVMSGSIIRQFPVSPGDQVEAKFSTLGNVQIAVSD